MFKTFEDFSRIKIEPKLYSGILQYSGKETTGQLIVFNINMYILSDENIFEGNNTILIGADEETLVDPNTVKEL